MLQNFAQRLIAWQRRHGRHDLPWQNTRDPYRVWLAEVMLQQTQVATVIPYYARFLARFPRLDDLAAASLDEVMTLWSGLGYYARARNLHRCACQVVALHRGDFPRDPAILAQLPGIGRSTANAIAAFCFGVRAPILDGNVKRLLCRHFGIAGDPSAAPTETHLWQIAEELLPKRRVATYLQAQMDLGALVCTRSRPRCSHCPVAASCRALHEGRTAELPTPRSRRVLPQRQVTLLALLHAGRIALERRPPAGVWGSLWSLPELPTGREAADFARDALGLRLSAVQPAPSLQHDFTHFRLHIQPLICRVAGVSGSAESRLFWCAHGDLAHVALPAPLRRLINGIL
jgi:A/G-specific adenine glycosylase